MRVLRDARHLVSGEHLGLAGSLGLPILDAETAQRTLAGRCREACAIHPPNSISWPGSTPEALLH